MPPMLADFRWTFSTRGGDDWDRALLAQLGAQLGFGELAGSSLSWSLVGGALARKQTFTGGVSVRGVKKAKQAGKPCSELQVSFAMFDKAGKLVAFSNDFQEADPYDSRVSFRSKGGYVLLDKKQIAELVTAAAPKPAEPWLHTDGIGAIAFDGSGRLVTMGSADKTIRVWNDDGSVARAIATGAELDLGDLAFSPADDWCAVITWTGKLLRCSLADGKVEPLGAPAKGHSSPRVAVSPDGKTIAGFHEETLFRCAANGAGLIKTKLRAIGGDWAETASALAFSPDSSTLAVRCDDGVGIYDRALKRIATHAAPGTFVAWTTEGIWLAAGSTLRLLDPKTLVVKRERDLPEGKVTCLADKHALVLGETAAHVVPLAKGASTAVKLPKGFERYAAMSRDGQVAFAVGARVIR